MMLYCGQNILPSSCLFLVLTIASYFVCVCLCVCICVCVCVCVCVFVCVYVSVHSIEVHKFEYSGVNQLVKYKNNKTLSTLDLDSLTVLKKLTIHETCHNFGFGPPRCSSCLANQIRVIRSGIS